MANDWPREMLETVPYLRGQKFVRKDYKHPRPSWDHDHCAVCGQTLVEPDRKASNVTHEGYASTSEYQHGEDYEWICVACFIAFKEDMGWQDATPA
jgi:hypothetical protein